MRTSFRVLPSRPTKAPDYRRFNIDRCPLATYHRMDANSRKGLATMADGYFIRKDDRTSCGGIALDPLIPVYVFGMAVCREGDPVTCGVTGLTYGIVGGISHIVSYDKRVAGTLDSVSGCPCRAAFEPSQTSVVYGNDHVPESVASVAAPGLAPGQRPGQGGTALDKSGGNEIEKDDNHHSDSEIEEEEEEVEQEQLITLRIGVFFDGTGNNQANSESVAGCTARDVGLQEQGEELRRFCAERGFDVDGSTPDDSYGNDTSNIARLYDLYRDQAHISIEPDATEAAVKVYLEGIGTVSGGADNRYGQATGRWGTGVLARVEQSPALIMKRLDSFTQNNPTVKIKRIEIDIFGFSRGAAAARHFANDLHKGASSLLAKTIPAGSEMFVDTFSWQVQRDVTVNFIGLFDTVAGIVSPLVGDFSPGNARVSGLNLGLSASVARKVVQLVARDEHRLNFSLTRTDNDIVLPGAHSDIGGGYLPRSRERLLLSKPLTSIERVNTPLDHAMAVARFRRSGDPWLDRLKARGIDWRAQVWSVEQRTSRDDPYPEKRVYVAALLEREVEGDLSKVYLRIMRELAASHQAPFDVIEESDQRFALPPELIQVAEKLRAYAIGESSTLGLTQAEESLLYRRYIHLSANWNALKNWRNSDLDVVFINRPGDNHQRSVHANE